MKKLVIISMIVMLFFLSININVLAGDRRRGHHDSYRFDRNFERSFGTTLGIGAGIIATDIINQAFNTRYYYTPGPRYYYQPAYNYYGYQRYRRSCAPRY